MIKKILPFFLLLVTIVVITILYNVLDKKHIVDNNFEIHLKDGSKHNVVFGVNHKNEIAQTKFPFYYKEFLIKEDTNVVQYIICNLDNKSYKIDTKQISSSKYTFKNENGVGVNYFSLPKTIFYNQSVFPKLKEFINWKGDGNLLKEILINPFLLFVLLVFIGYYVWRKFNIQIPTQPKIMDQQNYYWDYLCWLPFIFLVVLIFNMDKYYFLQDDNYAQFTPVLVDGLNGIYNDGTFPTYTPLQFGGVPTFEYSTYSFLYPITHLSYLIARFGFKDVWLFNNIFSIVHFAIGYFFTYKLFSFFKINKAIAVVAALSFIFCGFNLEASRSWYYVAPTIAFLPLLFFYRIKIGDKKFSFKNYCNAIVLLTIYAYSGNFQFWVYTLLLLFLLELFINAKQFLVALKNCIIISIGVLVLFSPQLLLTYNAVKDIARPGGEGLGIWGGMGSFLFPNIINNKMPSGWGSEMYYNYSQHFYFGGFIFTFIGMAFITLLIIHFKRFKNILRSNKYLTYFIFSFCIVFLLSIGRPAILWPIQSKLPIFKNFNHPFKWLLYVHFSIIFIGTFVIQFLYNYNYKKIVYFLLTVSFGLLVLHVSQTKDAFFVYNLQNKPYAKPNYLSKLDSSNNYKVVSVSVARSEDSLYCNSLMLNFAMANKINSMDGYEPLSRNDNNIFENHQNYGIRYFVLGKYKMENPYFRYIKDSIKLFKNYEKLVQLYDDNQVTILENKNYEPLIKVYNEKDNLINVPFKIIPKNNGLRVQFTNYISDAKKVMINYSYFKNFKVYSNNETNIKIEKDTFNRIVIYPKQPFKDITVQYKLKFF